MNSVILKTMAPFLTVLMLVFSVFVLLRGHNAPGGGFIGGLLAASAIALYALAFGVEATRRALKAHPMAIAGGGLLLSTLSGLVSWLAGMPFMTGLWFKVAGVDLSTVMSFDLGVYLVVLGAFSTILLALEEREDP
ncbi:multicomponent Na+:H+ antiporter subunit B [Rhizobium sp. SG_E_25_P2]|jgi:multicomponent Na+:H+ antiporter subunit B|uniref:Na+/H+ antiporter subunit B n=1 Tax=Rhizobium sp. SG_E_25_P2 TaxID=2879942 RepID=UPI0024770D9B|nr:Na+/H+ antiporter subunit B [Rhizobium sp. SG_E_25_P2]MDH6269147.1 multicomponent Na+:H+ antiporter subunit B [Rhizobium sp. SG_E_25_P2]